MDPIAFINVRFYGEAANTVIFILLWIFSAGALIQKIYNIRRAKVKNYFPLSILILSLVLCSIRVVTQMMQAILDFICLLNGQVDRDPITEQISFGIDLPGYSLGIVQFGVILIAWSRILLGIIDVEETNRGVKKVVTYMFIAFVVFCIVTLVISMIPATIVYFTCVSIYDPNPITITLYYISIPYYVLISIVLSLLMIVIGIYVMIKVGRIFNMKNISQEKKTAVKTASTKEKCSIIKMTISLIVIPGANILRAIATVIYGFQIQYVSYVCSIFLLTGPPDMMIILTIGLCFSDIINCT